jgi:hypothetical protein
MLWTIFEIIKSLFMRTDEYFLIDLDVEINQKITEQFSDL